MLIRHVAGVPTAHEQRCLRCCEVIATKSDKLTRSAFPSWPGAPMVAGPCGGDVQDCKPVDLSEREVQLRGIDRPNIPTELL